MVLLKWVGSRTFALSVKVPEEEVRSVDVPVTHWNKNRTRALYYVDPEKTGIDDFEPLFTYCYRPLAADATAT